MKRDWEAIAMRQLRYFSILWFLFAMAVAGTYLALQPVNGGDTHVIVDHNSD